jgi:hypothetical protein
VDLTGLMPVEIEDPLEEQRPPSKLIVNPFEPGVDVLAHAGCTKHLGLFPLLARENRLDLVPRPGPDCAELVPRGIPCQPAGCEKGPNFPHLIRPFLDDPVNLLSLLVRQLQVARRPLAERSVENTEAGSGLHRRPRFPWRDRHQVPDRSDRHTPGRHSSSAPQAGIASRELIREHL